LSGIFEKFYIRVTIQSPLEAKEKGNYETLPPNHRSHKYMKIQSEGETLTVSGLTELAASNSGLFRDQVRAAITEDHHELEIDLSETTFVDSCGLGALIALHKTLCSRNGILRLLNPTAPVQQVLELTRMHRIFEIVKS
jgi:anti-sigma B factor antagonist